MTLRGSGGLGAEPPAFGIIGLDRKIIPYMSNFKNLTH
jgi:hypothetical protein